MPLLHAIRLSPLRGGFLNSSETAFQLEGNSTLALTLVDVDLRSLEKTTARPHPLIALFCGHSSAVQAGSMTIWARPPPGAHRGSTPVRAIYVRRPLHYVKLCINFFLMLCRRIVTRT